jgi:hypothetical protein
MHGVGRTCPSIRIAASIYCKNIYSCLIHHKQSEQSVGYGDQALCAAGVSCGPPAARSRRLAGGGAAGGRLLQQDMPQRRGHRPRGDGEDHLRRAQPRRTAPQAPLPRLLRQGKLFPSQHHGIVNICFIQHVHVLFRSTLMAV